MKNSKLITKSILCAFIICAMNIRVFAQQPSKPNIVMVLIDDQDMDEISTYGGQVYTPNMDRLAAEGIKFNNAYVSSTVCTPSRYGFMTGRYAGRSYSNHYKKEVGDKKQGFPGFNVALENDKMNVTKVLNEAGYVTGYTGKYYLASAADQPEMYKDQRSSHKVYSKEEAKKLKPSAEFSKEFEQREAWGRKYLKHMGFDCAKNIYEGNLEWPYKAHNPEWTASAVFEFLDENHDQPFFLQCCPTLLHGPDSEWVNSYDKPDYTGAGEIKAPPSVMKKRKELREKLIELGYDPKSGAWGPAWIDAMLGEIMAKLEELKIADNTLVIFAPDHGSEDKACLYGIDGAQIPLLMRWPNGIPAGIECDELVQNIDLAPTYFELAGGSIPKEYHIDGRSLVPLFKNGKTRKWRDHLYLELGNARAVVTKDMKYIATRYSKEHIQKIKSAEIQDLPVLMCPLIRSGIGVRGADHPGFWDEDQLYNLEVDPKEMDNLASKPEYSKELGKMKKILTGYVKEIGRPFGEFYYSGNAALPGQVESEIFVVKQIILKGKSVIVPEHLKK